MAITWEFDLTPVIVGATCDAVAVRTDDTPDRKQYTVTSKSVDTATPGSKAAALDALWKKYEKEVEAYDAEVAYQGELDALEIVAKQNFEGREP
ncbi:unnamed protein product [marine sediment metagenome]|uniref:Uncharacterized protein n=1 Tax=marine sediment metagenome TaxID=412755 RepID=X0V5R7_9ZZZZ